MRAEAGTYRAPGLRSDHPRLLRSGPAHPSCLFARTAIHTVLKTSSLGLCFGIYPASLDLAFAFSLSSTCLLSLAFLNGLSWVFEVPLRCHLFIPASFVIRFSPSCVSTHLSGHPCKPPIGQRACLRTSCIISPWCHGYMNSIQRLLKNWMNELPRTICTQLTPLFFGRSPLQEKAGTISCLDSSLQAGLPSRWCMFIVLGLCTKQCSK